MTNIYEMVRFPLPIFVGRPLSPFIFAPSFCWSSVHFRRTLKYMEMSLYYVAPLRYYVTAHNSMIKVDLYLHYNLHLSLIYSESSSTSHVRLPFDIFIM